MATISDAAQGILKGGLQYGGITNSNSDAVKAIAERLGGGPNLQSNMAQVQKMIEGRGTGTGEQYQAISDYTGKGFDVQQQGYTPEQYRGLAESLRGNLSQFGAGTAEAFADVGRGTKLLESAFSGVNPSMGGALGSDALAKYVQEQAAKMYGGSGSRNVTYNPTGTAGQQGMTDAQKNAYYSAAGITPQQAAQPFTQGAVGSPYTGPGASQAMQGGQPFVPPNQDAGMARNLSEEQKFVKNWGGKGGRLPTSQEINQAVYGTPNPSFNTVQGIKPPIDPDKAEYDAAMKAISGGQATDKSVVTGTAPIVPPTPPAPGGGNIVATPSPITPSPSGGGGTTSDGTPAATPTPVVNPPATGGDYLDALQRSMQETANISPEEKVLQDQRNAIKQLIDQQMANETAGINEVRNQQIMERFITGQSAAIERQSQAKLANYGRIQQTLQDQLSEAQKTRAERRQAALDVAGIEDKRATRASQAAETTADQSFRERQLAEQIAQNKREMEMKAATDKADVELKLGAENYDYVATPKERDELKKKGYDIIVVGGRTYAKPPEVKKTTGPATSNNDKEIKAFQNDAAQYIEKLGTGAMDWGTAWNIMRAKYPQASNELIDQMLNKDAYYPR